MASGDFDDSQYLDTTIDDDAFVEFATQHQQADHGHNDETVDADGDLLLGDEDTRDHDHDHDTTVSSNATRYLITSNDELEQIKRALTTTRAELETKTGEIATIRRNFSRADAAHHSQLASLRAELADAKRRHEEDLKRLADVQEKLRAENAFLQHDLRDSAREKEKEGRKARGKSGRGGDDDDAGAGGGGGGGVVRPGDALGDGFDADEMLYSPSRRSEKIAKRVKRSPAKKRSAAIDGEQLKLELSQTRVGTPTPTSNFHDDGFGMGAAATATSSVGAAGGEQLLPLIQKLLNHRTAPHRARDLEVFTTIAFPSQPDTPFSSLILSHLPSHNANFAAEYARLILSLWQRCLSESFYEPIGMLMRITSYIINDVPYDCPSLPATPSLSSQLIPDLIPILISTVLTNAEPRYFASPTHQEKQRDGQLKAGHPRPVRVALRPTPLSALNTEVDSTAALRMLYGVIVAAVADGDDDAIRRFWACVRWDFIYKMLNAYQRIEDLELVVAMLEYSIRPTTLGPLLDGGANGGEMQADSERIILERMAHLLHEPLSVDEGEERVDCFRAARFRVQVMLFLSTAVFSYPNPPADGAASAAADVEGMMSTNHRVARTILDHHAILPHIFNTIHDALMELYSLPPHGEHRAALINGLVRVSYAVLHTFPGANSPTAAASQSLLNPSSLLPAPTLPIDLPAKLRASTIRRVDGFARTQIRGIARKFLLAMTRIAFGERLVLDVGLGESCVGMCHEMLDECVSREEAGWVVEVFREMEGESEEGEGEGEEEQEGQGERMVVVTG